MSDVADVKAHADLVSIAESRGVELRRSGVQFVGLCPFHTERSPSFYVHPERGFFCHGCGAKGDAINFVMMIDGVRFEEAIAALSGGVEPRRSARRPTAPSPQPTRDAGALWTGLAEHDDEGEAYLAGRGLLLRDPGVLRFNVGDSGDLWLDARAREGYRVGFAARCHDGTVQTISLRYVRPEGALGGKKTLVLAGCPTHGAAIVSPGIWQLVLGDPEFAGDRILVVEGGTDWLGASALFSEAAADMGAVPTWPIAAIGVTQAAGVVAAFAHVVKWRTILVGLDADDSGRAAVPGVVAAARKAGARETIPVEVPLGAKDWADLARMEYIR